jgi:hypothetical protein
MWFVLQDLTKMINEKNESNAAGKAQQSGGQLAVVSPSAARHSTLMLLLHVSVKQVQCNLLLAYLVRFSTVPSSSTAT